MYIEPSTIIRILKNVPLDNTYKNTIYFSNKEEQTNYFIGKTKHIFTQQTYQRVNKGTARVNVKVESLYDCNYMMFQNSEFGDKWFYAFITSVEYVNNVVSEISFEIDVMQTWLPTEDYTLKECFVEREHSANDIIGENLVPENLELGEYVASDFSDSGHLRSYKIVIAATMETTGVDAVGGEYAGIYSGLRLNVFNTYEEANAWISKVNSEGRADGIVSVFMMPSDFVTNIGEPVKYYNVNKMKHYSNLDGHVVRNKKLFTYPYNFLYVSNLEGNHAVFCYEFFSEGECTFQMTGDFSCNPGLLLIPLNYKGVPANIDEKMFLGGFPQCSWNTDAFKAWIAQNGASLAVGTLSGIAGGIARGVSGDKVGGAISGVSSVLGALATTYEHYIMPNQAHGPAGGSTQLACRIKDFAFMHKHITAEFASIIDDYFDMYGYATHKVKVPNISSRPYWNYVKTIDCDILGSMPADDINKICSIYNNGITFWKNGDNIGDYGLDNSV